MNVNDKYLNNLIGQCFVNGLIEDFQLMMNFIAQYPDKCKHDRFNKIYSYTVGPKHSGILKSLHKILYFVRIELVSVVVVIQM